MSSVVFICFADASRIGLNAGGNANITVGIVRVAAANEVETSRKVRVTREIEVL